MNKIALDKNKMYPGMPTVAYDDSTYSLDYWRGPTWLNVAYFAVRGLEKYGCSETASQIREYLLNMTFENINDGIFENYDSINKKGLCCPNFSWSAVFTIEFVLNYNGIETV